MYSKAAFIPAILWLVISTILLSLPASDIPEIGFFDLPYFDKLVHIGMFMLLSGLFSYPLTLVDGKISTGRRLIIIAVYSLLYGVIMEFVQKHFIAGRSFDFIDIICDGIGSSAGAMAVWILCRKKIGPDGNRGRNQN